MGNVYIFKACFYCEHNDKFYSESGIVIAENFADAVSKLDNCYGAHSLEEITYLSAHSDFDDGVMYKEDMFDIYSAIPDPDTNPADEED